MSAQAPPPRCTFISMDEVQLNHRPVPTSPWQHYSSVWARQYGRTPRRWISATPHSSLFVFTVCPFLEQSTLKKRVKADRCYSHTWLNPLLILYKCIELRHCLRKRPCPPLLVFEIKRKLVFLSAQHKTIDFPTVAIVISGLIRRWRFQTDSHLCNQVDSNH